MANVLGLGGVFFKSPDPESLAKWYQEWLGMDLGYPYGISFKTEMVPKNGNHVWSPFKSDTKYFEPSTNNYMFNLIVDNLDDMLAQIKPSGCKVMDETERGEYGDFGWFIDPDGNKVELWQPPLNAPNA